MNTDDLIPSPPKPTAAQVRAAALTCCHHADTIGEAREWLQMLGVAAYERVTFTRPGKPIRHGGTVEPAYTVEREASR